MVPEPGERKLLASGAFVSGLLSTYAKTTAAWAKIIADDRPLSPEQRREFVAEMITVANGIHSIIEGERSDPG